MLLSIRKTQKYFPLLAVLALLIFHRGKTPSVLAVSKPAFSVTKRIHSAVHLSPPPLPELSPHPKLHKRDLGQPWIWLCKKIQINASQSTHETRFRRWVCVHRPLLKVRQGGKKSTCWWSPSEANTVGLFQTTWKITHPVLRCPHHSDADSLPSPLSQLLRLTWLFPREGQKVRLRAATSKGPRTLRERR